MTANRRTFTDCLISSFYRFLARFSGRRRGLVRRLTAAMRSSFIPCIFLVINSFALPLVEGCSSRTMPKPRPPTTRVSTARPNVTYNTYPCEPGYDTTLCLNGGTCFIVKVTDTGLYNCMCADGFVGQRCEYKNLDGSYMPPRHRVMLETASIASGATIAVFLVVIICMYIYMHTKRRQKQSLSTSNEEMDGDLERRNSRSSISSKRENSTPRLPLHHVTRESGSESTSYPVYAETTLTPPIREIKEPP